MPQPGELGPDRQLLERKRREKEDSRQQAREKANRRRMTEDERAEAVRAMQMDASRRDEFLNQAVASKKHDHDEIHSTNEKSSAAFLQDMAAQTHGIRDGTTSLASRVAQRRHTNQRPNDDFL
jgi:flagellum-specific peptidoglycan hydrolase FlgJ